MATAGLLIAWLAAPASAQEAVCHVQVRITSNGEADMAFLLEAAARRCTPGQVAFFGSAGRIPINAPAMVCDYTKQIVVLDRGAFTCVFAGVRRTSSREEGDGLSLPRDGAMESGPEWGA